MTHVSTTNLVDKGLRSPWNPSKWMKDLLTFWMFSFTVHEARRFSLHQQARLLPSHPLGITELSISNLVYSFRKLFSANFATRATWTFSESILVAKVRISSACRNHPALKLFTKRISPKNFQLLQQKVHYQQEECGWCGWSVVFN